LETSAPLVIHSRSGVGRPRQPSPRTEEHSPAPVKIRTGFHRSSLFAGWERSKCLAPRTTKAPRRSERPESNGSPRRGSDRSLQGTPSRPIHSVGSRTYLGTQWKLRRGGTRPCDPHPFGARVNSRERPTTTAALPSRGPRATVARRRRGACSQGMAVKCVARWRVIRPQTYTDARPAAMYF